MSESPSTAPAATATPSEATTGSPAPARNNVNDTLLIVFGLLFLAGPFIFMLQWLVGLIYVAVTTPPAVYLLCKAETVVDRLSKGEDRYAAAVKPEVTEASAAAQTSASGDAAATAPAGAESVTSSS